MGWPKGRRLTPEEVARRVEGGRAVQIARRRKPRMVGEVAFWECKGCSCWFASERFFNATNNSSGLSTRCRPCHCADSVRTRDPVRHRTQKRESVRRERLKNPERFWELALQRAYGITVADYERILASQGGVCAICRRAAMNRLGRRMPVDHDHVTGVVRGILCHWCNVGIGSLGDDPDRLESAARYVRDRAGRKACA